jgi:hypothetical protein
VMQVLVWLLPLPLPLLLLLLLLVGVLLPDCLAWALFLLSQLQFSNSKLLHPPPEAPFSCGRSTSSASTGKRYSYLSAGACEISTWA